MKLFAFVLALTCLPLSVAAGNVALVIGNSSYDSVADLPNPGNDAALIAQSLTNQGFEVTHRDDLDLSGMRRELRAFRDKADSAEMAIVYYAGHGIEVAGMNFLVPVDANLADERDASIELVTVEDVLSQISGARTMKMVVLDACRNNPFVAKMKREGSARNVGRGLGRIDQAGADTLIAYAAAAGDITPDGPEGENSPFTRAFANALMSPPADVRQLLGIVRDEMRQTVPGAAPFVYSSLGGSRYIINARSAQPEEEKPAESARAPTAPAAQPDAQTSIYVDFAKAEMVGTPSGWEDFLNRYDAFQHHSLYALALGKKSLLERQVARAQASVPAPAAKTPEPPATTATAASEPAPQTAPAATVATAPTTPPATAPETAPETRPAKEQPGEQPGERVAFLEPAPSLDTVPSASAGQPVAASEALPLLSSKEATRAIQQILKDNGCYRGPIDGLLGRGSTAGLAQFAELTGRDVALASKPTEAELNAALAVMRDAPAVECKTKATVRRTPATTAPRQTRRQTRTAPAPSAPVATTTKKRKRSWGCAGQNDAYYCIDE